MKKRINNIVIYSIVFIIIFASFVIPNKLFEIKEKDIQIAVYINNNTQNFNNISVEAKDIELVKAIHYIENEQIGVMISSSQETEKVLITDQDSQNVSNLKQEMQKFKENNLIKDIKFSDDSELLISVIKKVYRKDKTKYTINNISLIIDGSNYKLDIEDKTGKIIQIVTKKENFNIEISREEILKKYIHYLNLDIIDDWKYEDNMMKSQKAELSVSIIESVNSGMCILSIHSNSKISNNIVEYDFFEN